MQGPKRLVAAAFCLLFSQAAAAPLGLEKWSEYQPRKTQMGLHPRPLEVRYVAKAIYINQRRLNDVAAVELLRRSRELRPVPTILVLVENGDLNSALPFLRQISRAGVCDRGACKYRVIRR